MKIKPSVTCLLYVAFCVKCIGATPLSILDTEPTSLPTVDSKLEQEHGVVKDSVSDKVVDDISPNMMLEKASDAHNSTVDVDTSFSTTEEQSSKFTTPGMANSTTAATDKSSGFSSPLSKSGVADFPQIELFKSPEDKAGISVATELDSVGKSCSVSLLEAESDLKLSHTTGIVDEEDISASFGKMKIKSKKYIKRLFLGEADFSYTVALLKKHEISHPGIATEIIATELAAMEKLQENYPDTFSDNLSYLIQRQVDVRYDVDARKIHELFSGERIRRIHFNFPHDGSNYKAQTLPTIIAEFFLSARKIQNKGDRVYMALPYKKGELWQEKCSLGNNYRIYEASICNGYQLIKKRRFKEDEVCRYNGYQHRETKSNQSASSATQYCREYVFERMFSGIKGLTQEVVDTIQKNSPSRTLNVKKSSIRHTSSEDLEHIDSLPFLDTDNDSSAYEDDD
ncbi:MAG: Rossmann-like fold-containing protein [Pseudomonadota bacterium]